MNTETLAAIVESNQRRRGEKRRLKGELRNRILDALYDGPSSAYELAIVMSTYKRTTLAYLRALEKEGLVHVAHHSVTRNGQRRPMWALTRTKKVQA